MVTLALSTASAKAPVVTDETRSAARQMARDAIELMNSEKYAEAEELLRRAFELVPAPTVAVLRGRALEELDRLIEAAESYEAARRAPVEDTSPDAFRDAQREAAERLSRVRNDIPLITITVVGIEPDDERLTIRVDDEVVRRELIGVRRPLDPGQHVIIASLGDAVQDTRSVTLTRGKDIKAVMRIDAPPPRAAPARPSPPKPIPRRPDVKRRIGVAGVAIGSAALATGIVSGIVMLGHKAELDEGCRPTCPARLEGDLLAFRRSRMISATSYGIGFTSLALGAGALFTAPPRPEPRRAAKSRRAALAITTDRDGGAVSVRGYLP